MMNGANNKRVDGQSITNKIFDSFSGESIGNSVINSITAGSSIAGIIKDTIDKEERK